MIDNIPIRNDGAINGIDAVGQLFQVHLCTFQCFKFRHTKPPNNRYGFRICKACPPCRTSGQRFHLWQPSLSQREGDYLRMLWMNLRKSFLLQTTGTG